MRTDARGPRIIARSIFRQLLTEGYSSQELIGVASELIELITSSLQDARLAGELAVSVSNDSHNSAETPPAVRRRGLHLHRPEVRERREVG
ncbi:hypothetical protein NR798_42030 [Archangium gephyra]|uniref:hypothetical protein n=1 Tax=Archangium gephyra TaxID=48 RepID=UPI0035D48BDC